MEFWLEKETTLFDIPWANKTWDDMAADLTIRPLGIAVLHDLQTYLFIHQQDYDFSLGAVIEEICLAYIGAVTGLIVGLLLRPIVSRFPSSRVELGFRFLAYCVLFFAIPTEWFWARFFDGSANYQLSCVYMVFMAAVIWVGTPITHPNVPFRACIHTISAMPLIAIYILVMSGTKFANDQGVLYCFVGSTTIFVRLLGPLVADYETISTSLVEPLVVEYEILRGKCDRFVAKFHPSLKETLPILGFACASCIWGFCFISLKYSVLRACLFLVAAVYGYSLVAIRSYALTDFDVDSIRFYTEAAGRFEDRAGYIQMNTALRGEQTMSFYIWCRNLFLKLALSKLPRFRGPVRRRTKLGAHIAATLVPGQEFSDPAFFSTTLCRPPAGMRDADYMSEWDGNHIFVVESRSGRRIYPYSALPEEMEVLFFPGTKFIIDEVTPPEDPHSRKPTTVVRMHEI